MPFIGTYADEAVGAVYGDQARDAWRATSKAMDQEKPWQSAGLQLAGGITATVPALMAAGPGIAAESLGGNMLRGGRLTSALVGASRPRQLEDSVAATRNLDFSDEELTRIDAIVKR